MKARGEPASSWHAGGFSLLELMISMTILVIIITLTFSITTSVSATWQKSISDIDAFQNARASFERITRNLGQATLHPYWDYRRDASGKPTDYVRRSDLHFVSGLAADTLLTNSVAHGVLFQAPAGWTETASLQSASNLLNVLGYYIEFLGDAADTPAWIASLPGHRAKSRFRLMEIQQPTENMQVFEKNDVQPTWLANPVVARPISDNCIALILSPRLTDQDDPKHDALAPNYSYNSRQGANSTPQAVTAHQLPPCVLVTLVAISEKSALRLTQSDANPSALQGKITTLLNGKFKDVHAYDADLLAVTDSLAGDRIDYHVFSTLVPLLESKWSQ